MSLLMKALEKAAKDRGDTRVEPVQPPVSVATSASAAAPARAELSLEPISPEAPYAARPEATTALRPGAPQRLSTPVTPAPEATQAQASTIMQAGAAGQTDADAGVVDYLRTHPLLALGLLAALFAAGFGVYVYFQIARPGFSIGTPPLAPKGPPPPPLVEAPRAPAAVPAALPEPLPAGPVLREAAAESSATRRQKPTVAAAEEAAPRNSVVVSRGESTPAVNPLLGQAYAALQAGQLDQARRDYGQLASAEPKNVDALLGLAAIAVRIGDSEEATRRYLQVLEIDPRHGLAQGGLISLLGRADPAAAESRLRHLISLEPSPYLYFVLGNLYADQSNWAAAQQVYFQAHHLDPANPDYAYNLAVGLEHVGQQKLALGYYRRALQLASAKGRANFNISQAQERIGSLAAQVE
jgi:tetratricopeptide (TPR) repeat protein